jgi:hypothetical protein
MTKEEQRLKKENEFLDRNVFFGLTNLNDGFDSPDVKYFSEQDFEIVIQRVKELGLGIYGIEPWKDGDFYGVQVHEQGSVEPIDSIWYERSFQDFKDTGEKLQYAATFYIPDELIAD